MILNFLILYDLKLTSKARPFSAASLLANGLIYILSPDVVGSGFGTEGAAGAGGVTGDGGGVDGGEAGDVGTLGVMVADAVVAGVSSLKSLKAATELSSGTIIQTNLPIATFFVPAATIIFAR